MREEITEPKHWRTRGEHKGQRNNLWTTRSRVSRNTEIAADAVDEAITEVCQETAERKQRMSSDIVSNLASQLDLLERQREHLQRLLDQAQSS